jgi:hypothetical protein
MRASTVFMILAIAGPASAQPSFLAMAQGRDAQAAAEADAARNRDVALRNELAVLEARVQSDQALSNLQAARAGSYMPTRTDNPKRPPAEIDIGKLTSIPDATLAQSNARVLAAAANRR